MAKTQKQIDEFFKLKQEALETLQPRSQMILNDEPLYPTTEDVEEYDPFAKMKSKSELLEFLNEELQATVRDLDKISKKFPDFRKVKKNDMRYGETIERVHLLGDVIKWIKDLEELK
jgi:hypothetical protein